MPKTIKVFHSPDSDDAFMFYAILEKKIDLRGYEFEIDSAEIQELNEEAIKNPQSADILALSFHTCFLVEDKYQIMQTGSSMAGENYGPRLVAKEGISDQGLGNREVKIAIPGKYTSAFLVLQLYLKQNSLVPNPQSLIPSYIFCRYDEVFTLLEQNKVDASLLIHESQLKFQDKGYKQIVDLGQWWYQETNGLQMPLGCNAIRKDLGEEIINDMEEILQNSIKWGLENFDETLSYARTFANNDLNDGAAKKYIEMYVNDSTVNLSAIDNKSINLLKSLTKETNLLKFNSLNL